MSCIFSSSYFWSLRYLTYSFAICLLYIKYHKVFLNFILVYVAPISVAVYPIRFEITGFFPIRRQRYRFCFRTILNVGQDG